MIKPSSIFAALFVAALPASAEVTFNADIRPILSKKCVQCHGPDAEHRKADLRLDIADTDEGAHRVKDDVYILKPGDLENSELWYRIITDDEDDVMPPPDSHVKGITPEEKALIEEWILTGAQYEDFWAFVPPSEPSIPEVSEKQWSDEPIDQFVLAKLESKERLPSPKADKRTLIRRATLDLTGLPPTLDEIDAFLKDTSKDAYTKLVDRLLAKPQYGEHMTKYWLDLVRFGDTNGMHHDHYREASPYRDWVIRSFNDNLGYDDFLTYQVAGDLYENPTTDQLVASGFNRLHLIIDAGTALPEESFAKNVIDRVSSVGTAFMGLTLQCAVCHDHKFDPITQKDFFQIYAFFNNLDAEPETTGKRSGPDFRRGLQKPFLEFPTPEQEETRLLLKADVIAASAQLRAAKALQQASDDANKSDKKIKTLAASLKKAEETLEKHIITIPGTLISKERDEVRPTHIHIRGNYDQLGDIVERDSPHFLPPMPKKEGAQNRMDFAKWLIDPGNPLTARVAVNRLWQQFFGVGLVKTSEDFGAQGEWPSHPKLLDHLAYNFMESGWDIKDTVRTIVLTEAYQQSSKAKPQQFRDDPDNRLLARGSRFRLDSEVVRDQILALSGNLNLELYGKSVKPPQPDGLWETVTMPHTFPRSYKTSSGDDIYRRSLYTFWKRSIPLPQMTIFDAPSREACIARRERTNTPLQALVLMNEEQYFDAATYFASDLLKQNDLPENKKIEHAYQKVTSQIPDADTTLQLLGGLDTFREFYSEEPKLAADMISKSSKQEVREIKEPGKQAEFAAWTMLAHSLLNLDTTKTRE